MKTWTAIGAIFSFIGVVLLIAGFAVNPVLNALPYISGGQLDASLFWSAFAPFLIGSIIMFIMGGVAFYAGGSASTINVETPSPTITSSVEIRPPTFEMKEPNTAVSSKSKILCGSCGAINDIDAFYCKKCGKQL